MASKEREKNVLCATRASRSVLDAGIDVQDPELGVKHVMEKEDGREETPAQSYSASKNKGQSIDTMTSPEASPESMNTGGVRPKNSKKRKKARKLPSETQPTTVTQTASKAKPSDPPSQVSAPAKSSFEEELEWCIAQLELGMLRTGASKSQKQQNDRSLHTLQGTKTPLPKKRQLMRSLFGDYRSKMKTQPILESPVTKETKLEAVKPELIETVGTYYRHRAHRTRKGVDSHESTDFKFNFLVCK